MSKVYLSEGVSLGPLEGKTIAVLGFGIQGEAQALNLRDGGFKVVVGGRPGGKTEAANAAGFETTSYPEAAKKADVILFLLPDAAHPEVFGQIRGDLPGKAIVFAHGSSIHFNLVRPPEDCDVVLVAPSGPGKAVRESFLDKTGMVATFAVHQDASGTARETALALCKALGFTQAGVFESSFKDEAVCDLFGEQAVLCGGVPELLRLSYETLVERGYSKEMAYLGTLYELKALAALYASEGLDGGLAKVSEAARYGGFKEGPFVVGPEVKERMKEALSSIESGKFIAEFVKEKNAGFPGSSALLEKEKKSDMSKTGSEIRRQFRLKM